MKNIQFDSGIKEYKLNGSGVLRFNPGDPNLFARFLEAVEKFKALEVELAGRLEMADPAQDGNQAVQVLTDADKQMKDVLNWVFGPGNDMHSALGGVNLLAVAGNGERVITNLFGALQPILIAGAESCAKEKTEAAVKQAKARRIAR